MLPAAFDPTIHEINGLRPLNVEVAAFRRREFFIELQLRGSDVRREPRWLTMAPPAQKHDLKNIAAFDL